MSEQDYQRGLRGGDCINFDGYNGQHYKDWYAGKQEYERLKKEKEYEKELEMEQNLPYEVQREIWENRHKEREAKQREDELHRKEEEKAKKANAYKEADDNKFTGIGPSIFIFLTIQIGGNIISWILGFFKINMPSSVIWGTSILSVIIINWVFYNGYKKDLKDVNRRFGKRD